MWVHVFHMSLALAGRWMLKKEPGIRKQIAYRDSFTREAVDYNPYRAILR